jgi:hypothetical protein
MEGFSYAGKSAVQALQELCLLRRYPQPVFLDRSLPHSEIVAVTTIVGGKTYGSAEGTTSVIACENAAIVTLSAWLKEEFNPTLLKRIHQSKEEKIEDIAQSGEGAQANALSVFNLYAAAILSEAGCRPTFEVTKMADKFLCTLSAPLDSRPMQCVGEGKTKVIAKRVASFLMLQ